MENKNVMTSGFAVVGDASNDNENTTTTISANNVEDTNLSMDQIDQLTKYIHVQGIKDSLNSEMDKVTGARKELIGSLTGLDSEKDFIQEKLDTFASVEELQEYLKSDKNVDDFFVNPDNGEVIELSVAVDDPKRAMQFKRELLIYMKTTDIAHAAIDKEYDELEKATAAMDTDLREACIQLSDNVLSYIGYLKDGAENITDEVEKQKVLESAKYIESGYTFEVMQEILDEHPSVIKNTVNELTRGINIDVTGKRYTDKLKRYGIKVSLIPLVSNGENIRSVEEMVLIEDDEYKLRDLFMYSAIRYFAMANWDNDNVKRFHASLALVMKRLVSNEFNEDVRDRIIVNMVKYLAQFAPYIK